jgi:hypothetical protein
MRQIIRHKGNTETTEGAERNRNGDLKTLRQTMNRRTHSYGTHNAKSNKLINPNLWLHRQ